MSSSRPATRAELIAYCLRALGAPVIQINIDEDQIDDRLDEALMYYQDFHYDGIENVYRRHQITQTDINNQYLILPDDILSVKKVFPVGTNSAAGIFSLNYQYHLNEVWHLTSGNLQYYATNRMYYETYQMMFAGERHIRFQRHTNKLKIDIKWDDLFKVDDWMMIDCTQIIDPDVHTDVFNDQFLKKYATALLKKQWGLNLKKYDNVQLPGGHTINGQQIFDEAITEIQKLEEDMELNLKYSMPVDFMVG